LLAIFLIQVNIFFSKTNLAVERAPEKVQESWWIKCKQNTKTKLV